MKLDAPMTMIMTHLINNVSSKNNFASESNYKTRFIWIDFSDELQTKENTREIKFKSTIVQLCHRGLVTAKKIHVDIIS